VEVRFWIMAGPAAFFLFFFRLTGMGLIGPDEPRYAWVAREMARSGDWVTPRLWGQAWFEKPALPYWLAAAAFRCGLGADWAPRLPVACLSLLFLLLFYWRIKVEFGPAAARYAAAVLATSAGWVAYSRAAVFDMPLTATCSAAMLALLAWLDRRQPRWLIAAAVFLGLAVLAKGLVAPALAGLTLLCWAARKGAGIIRELLRPVPVLVFAVVCLPWYGLCYARNGSIFLREFFWKHHFERYAAGALAHNQPPWYFLPVLALFLLPWTPLAAALNPAAVWKEGRSFFLLLWAVVTVVFFSFSRDKLPGYVLPALPPLAALAGIGLARKRPKLLAMPLCALVLSLIPVAASVLPEALDGGLSAAIRNAAFPPVPLLAAVILAGMIWAFERSGRRPAAVAVLALSAAAGYGWVAWRAFPVIEQRAGTRALWQRAEAHRGSICLGDVSRNVTYGLCYYAEEVLPGCEDQPKPYRIEGRQVVFKDGWVLPFRLLSHGAFSNQRLAFRFWMSAVSIRFTSSRRRQADRSHLSPKHRISPG
jgi:4-amino-4-deoxy-L-arabinose transferase-like glycosyltransferase